MNTTRRDILKYFGAGTIIAPMAGGVTVTGRLIEPPKLELITPQPLIVKPFRLADIVEVTVSVKMRDGSVVSRNTNNILPPYDYCYSPTEVIAHEVGIAATFYKMDRRSPSSWQTVAKTAVVSLSPKV